MGTGSKKSKGKRNNSSMKGQPYQTLEEKQQFLNGKVFDSMFESRGST